MPEGPEVRTTVDCLDPMLRGKILAKLECEEVDKYFENDLSGYLRLSSLLPLQIKQVFCRGKQIYFHLGPEKVNNESNIPSSEVYLYSHLRMTGRWICKKGNHTRLTMGFGRKIKSTPFSLVVIKEELYYDDYQKLGKMKTFWSKAEVEADMARLGPDLLSEEVTYPTWQGLIQKYRRRSLVSFLMHQPCVSGVGNYLKAEILYRARLRPDRLISSLSEQESYTLWQVSIQIIRESYRHGGLTIKDFWNPLGRKGVFPIQIYGKDRDPYNNPVVTAKFSDGRTTHWVPALQV